MSSFTENLYLKRAIQKLQEENQQLLKLLNEVDINAGITPPVTPPSAPKPSAPRPSQRSVNQGGSPPTPNRGPWWDPMYGRGGFGVPVRTPEPITMPLPMKTPAPMTMPYQQPFSLDRPYDPNDDPNTTRPVKYGGGV